MKTAKLAVGLLLVGTHLPVLADAGFAGREGSSRAGVAVKNGELIRDPNAPGKTWGVVRDPLFIPAQWQEQAPKPEPILDEKAPKIREKKKGKKKSATSESKAPAPTA
ncbi:MAG: hypothetical protein ACJ75H_00405 [Thermoanaerobaculia bacterium]